MYLLKQSVFVDCETVRDWINVKTLRPYILIKNSYTFIYNFNKYYISTPYIIASTPSFFLNVANRQCSVDAIIYW